MRAVEGAAVLDPFQDRAAGIDSGVAILVELSMSASGNTDLMRGTIRSHVTIPAIADARAAGLWAQARELMLEYMVATAAELGGAPPTLETLPTVLQQELGDLDAAYAQPGTAWIAASGDATAGCVGIQLRGPAIAEVKRLYVRPAYRRHGVARLLMEAVHDHAVKLGLEKLVLDVMPARLSVIDWYRRLGYRDIEPYTQEPVPMVFLGRTVERRNPGI
jgi:ribosomal protein S18 acetylase RimI-like enzyme